VGVLVGGRCGAARAAYLDEGLQVAAVVVGGVMLVVVGRRTVEVKRLDQGKVELASVDRVRGH
jgi:hypothetical protein